MAKYEMLIAASGKRGSALLPCVVVDEKGIKRAAVHVEPRSRECPFCGAPTYEVVSVTGMKCVRCTNKKNCGAIVSFNNKDCDERGVSPAVYFNRRAGKE